MRSADEYMAMYQRSIQQPAEFWADMAQDLFWAKQVRRESLPAAGRPLSMEQLGLVSRHNPDQGAS